MPAGKLMSAVSRQVLPLLRKPVGLGCPGIATDPPVGLQCAAVIMNVAEPSFTGTPLVHSPVRVRYLEPPQNAGLSAWRVAVACDRVPALMDSGTRDPVRRLD